MTEPLERLGRILLEKGILSPEQLDDCLRDHRTSLQQGKPRELSEIVVSRGYLDPEGMTRVLETAAPVRKATRRATAPPPSRPGRWMLVAGVGAVLVGAAVFVIAMALGGREPEPAPVAETRPAAPPLTPVPQAKPPAPPPSLVAGDAEERRLQEAFLAALVAAIQKTPRDLRRLDLRSSSLDRVRILDATRETLFVRHADRAREVPWDAVDPAGVAELGQVFLPRAQGEPGLGLVVFCLRHRLLIEAARADLALVGTSEGVRSRKLIVDAGLAKAEENPPPPPPPPKPEEPRPLRAIARPAPKDPFQELLAGWTHRPDWKAYGPDLARALAERGWEDLAFEVTANLLKAPDLAPAAREEAFFAAASCRGFAAVRTADLEDRLALLEASIRSLRDLEGTASVPQVATRAREEQARLHQVLGRELLRAGRPSESEAAFAAGHRILVARVDALSRTAPRAGDPAWRQGRDRVLLAKLDFALAVLLQAEAGSGAPELVGSLVTFLEDLEASTSGAEIAGIEVSTLLGRACRLQALSAPREQKEALWRRALAASSAGVALLGTPAARAHPSVRDAIARSVLAEMKVRDGLADRPLPGSTAARLQALSRAESFLAAFPEARRTDPGLAIRLEAARLASKASQLEQGGKLLDEILRDSPSGSWSETAALELAAGSDLVRDPRRAGILADRLFERGGEELFRAARLYRSLGDARSRFRVGLAYAALGRPYESAAALAALKDDGDAALLRFRALRTIQELTGERKELDDLLARGLVNPNSPRLGELEIEIGRLSAARPLRPDPPELRVEGPLAGIALSKPPNAFTSRSQRKGAGMDTEAAVLLALRWLSRHQAKDGSWKTQGYISECRKVSKYAGGGNCTPNPGHEDFDAGVTGLALLAFLGAGVTPQSEEAHDGILFGEVVQRGLRSLVAQQDLDGCVGSRNSQKYMYNHGIGALALAEAYGLTQAFWLKAPAQKAIDFTAAAQNPGKGWRYSYKCGDNDSSVTGWQVMVLRAAELSGLSFPKSAYDGARDWYDEVTEEAYGRVGYTHRGTGKVFTPGLNEQFDHHEALTAFGVNARIAMDKNPGAPRLLAGCDLLVRDSPRWEGNLIDFYYWFVATNALGQFHSFAGSKWKSWNEDLKNAIVRNQNAGAGGCKNGSWETIDRWSGEGGRIYATAINALTLETYYRYPPVFGTEKPRR